MDEVEYLKTFFKSDKFSREFLFHIIYTNMKKSRNKYVKNTKIFCNPYEKDEYKRMLNFDRICDYDLLIKKKKEEYTSEYDKFIRAHLLIITNLMSKDLFSDMKFCDSIYNDFLVDYLKVNKKFVKENVTNHIDLASLIDPIITGLISYLRSKNYYNLMKYSLYRCFKECNSKIKFHGSFMFDKFKAFTLSDVFVENNILNHVKHYDCLDMNEYNNNFLKIIFKEVMINILIAVAFCIIDNYNRYDILKDIVKDCEMSIVSNSKITNFNNKEITAILSKITSIKNNFDSIKDYKVATNYLFDNSLMKIISTNKPIVDKIFSDMMKINPSRSPYFEIDKKQFYEIVIESDLLNSLEEYHKQINDQISRFYNYNISKHFRDIIKYDPLYILYLDEGININTLEVK